MTEVITTTEATAAEKAQILNKEQFDAKIAQAEKQYGSDKALEYQKNCFKIVDENTYQENIECFENLMKLQPEISAQTDIA